MKHSAVGLLVELTFFWEVLQGNCPCGASCILLCFFEPLLEKQTSPVDSIDQSKYSR